MDQWAGYLIVLGFGVFFSIVTTIMVKLEQVFGGLVISSEHFNTAVRNIKTGLTASVCSRVPAGSPSHASPVEPEGTHTSSAARS